MSQELSLPRRHSLIEETAEALRARISGNAWKNFLPGERSLAETLQVGRDTLRGALKILQDEGLVRKTTTGSRREIFRGTGKATRHRAGRVVVICPWQPAKMPPYTLLEIDTLRGLLFARGIDVKIIFPPCFHLKNPGKVLTRCLDEHDAKLWILYRSTQAMQEWFQNKKIPCLLRGHPHAGITLDKLDADWEATAYHAGLALMRAGHKHIGFIAPKEILQGIETAKKGLLRAFSGAGKISWISEPGTREGLCRILESVFRTKDAPTAFVVTQPREAATTLTWFGANKISVPGGVSLICLADDPNLSVLFPEITRYSTAAPAVARLLCRHVVRITGSTGSGKKNTRLFFPDFIEGATLAPPAEKQDFR